MRTDLKAIECLFAIAMLDPGVRSPPGDDSLRSGLEPLESLGREKHADPRQEGGCGGHECRDGCVADHLQACDPANGGKNDEENAYRNHAVLPTLVPADGQPHRLSRLRFRGRTQTQLLRYGLRGPFSGMTRRPAVDQTGITWASHGLTAVRRVLRSGISRGDPCGGRAHRSQRIGGNDR